METENRARFLHVQVKRIEVDKWCEGCGIERDPGKDYVMNWIKNYAGMFRLAWNNSLCKWCQHAQNCGYHVTKHCAYFEKILKADSTNKNIDNE